MSARTLTVPRATVLVGVLLLGAVAPAWSQDIPTADEERRKRLGFYFALSLNGLGQRGNAPGLGVLADATAPGVPVTVAGEEVGGTFEERMNLGFRLGFRLRNDNGWIEADFFQFEEDQDLGRRAANGQTVAATLASPDAGFFEDVGSTFVPGPPDGTVNGVEAGALSEGSEGVDPAPGSPGVQVLDGAEDVNFNGVADFIRFDSADEIVGEIQTDFQNFDIDYRRRIKKMRRFELQGRAGIRLASVTQDTDLGYRQNGSFAVYLDQEGCTGCSPEGPRTTVPILDGDGDGESRTGDNEPDGDGFLDGDEDQIIDDRIESVATVSEDRIVSSIDTKGVGLKLGVDGIYDLGKKWRLRGGIAVSVLQADREWRHVETFVSERDRYLNFFDWDLNGDGVFDNRDLNFDGDCGTDPNCGPTVGDDAAVPDDGVEISQRTGAENSVVRAPAGLNSDAYRGANAGSVRVGDPIPESERNTDVVRETTVLRDVGGSDSKITPMLDLHVGAEYQFSRFAHVAFGLRSSRWYDAGRFRTLANDVVAGRGDDLNGDFALDGWYVMLTIVPR